MRPNHILFLDDLLRKEYLSARGFVYACISEPLRQALGIRIPDGRRFPVDRGMPESFDTEHFSALAGGAWQRAYGGIPDEACEYLAAHIPAGSLVIGYEMPPWLLSVLDRHDIQRIDLRLSPLRFGRDLAFAVNAKTPNSRSVRAWSSEVIRRLRTDAGLMSASVQHNGPLATGSTGPARLVYVGQTFSDAALLDDDGELVRVHQFRDQLLELLGDREMTYAAHPYGGAFARREQAEIGRILGRRVRKERSGLYALMAGRENVEFVGLSSGAIQEARFFDRKATMLFRPICPVDDEGGSVYAHATLGDLTEPAYWLALCGEGPDYVGAPGPTPENLTRRLHNAWWGYAEYFIDNDRFWRRVLTRGFRNILRQLIQR